MEFPLADMICEPAPVCFGIRAPDAVKIDVALHAARVFPIHVVTTHASLDVPTSPLSVPSPSRADAGQDPGPLIARQWAVPDRLEPALVPFNSVTFNAEVRGMAGRALSFLARRIHRVRKPVVQLVLPL